MTNLRRLVSLNVVGTYALILFGGYVASSGAGMGCGPDWPLCNGDVVPMLQGETLVEFAHRVFGGLVALLTVLTAVYVRKWFPVSSRGRRISHWLLALLGGQVMLGAITVWFHLPPAISTLHLLLALTFLAVYWGLGREIRQQTLPERVLLEHSTERESTGEESAGEDRIEEESGEEDNVGEKKRPVALRNRRVLALAVGLTYLTLGLGAWVKHTGVGVTCGWLSCGPGLLPSYPVQWLQSAHRFSGFALALLVLLIVYQSWRNGQPRSLQRRALLLGGLVLLQVALGIVTVLTTLALPVSVAHLAVATAFFVALWDMWLADTGMARVAESPSGVLSRPEADAVS